MRGTKKKKKRMLMTREASPGRRTTEGRDSCQGLGNLRALKQTSTAHDSFFSLALVKYTEEEKARDGASMKEGEKEKNRRERDN